MADIMSASRAQGLRVRLTTLGPFFRVTAARRGGGSGGEGETEEVELGRAQGVVRPWPGGAVLHLDSMRMSRATLQVPDRPLFGLGVFLGAVAVRHGFDAGCKRAELLAINDTDLYHSKVHTTYYCSLGCCLVRFYSRMGFKTVHEVDGSSMIDLAHMLVWGGRGTRMDADIEQLLIKWSKRFRSQD
ncbi:Os10g0351100 [Oryza sativa Japonica Group]|uniref:Os10g0351100 protein n=2 Tax=Oryza TaxID=4527 RepID=C7J7M1_ORYSJ|nr:Os10g0351100 [Oryza sativa Japonica Group]|eukprot:NP_001176098.1 Os10g0351100 [Oryza sativa Japonica Group]